MITNIPALLIIASIILVIINMSTGKVPLAVGVLIGLLGIGLLLLR